MAELLATFEANVQKLTSTRKTRKKGAAEHEVLKGFGFDTADLKKEIVAQLIDMQHENHMLRVKIGPSEEHKTAGMEVCSVRIDAHITKVASTRKRHKLIGSIVSTAVPIETAKMTPDQVADLSELQLLTSPPEVTIQCLQAHFPGMRGSDKSKKATKKKPAAKKKAPAKKRGRTLH